MKYCKKCGKKLTGRLKVYCSRLCQNRYQAKHNNGFKGKHHKKSLIARWKVDRKKTYNLSYHKPKCQCSFCKTVRHETVPPMKLKWVRQKLSRVMKGRKILWKDKVSEGVKLAFQEGRLKKRIGPSNNLYIDGRETLRSMIRFNEKSRQWRNRIFQRDKFTCQDCGSKRRSTLQTHHTKPFKIIYDEFASHFSYLNPVKDKHALLQLAINEWPDFWNLRFGTTLCKECHEKLGISGPKVYEWAS